MTLGSCLQRGELRCNWGGIDARLKSRRDVNEESGHIVTMLTSLEVRKWLKCELLKSKKHQTELKMEHVLHVLGNSLLDNQWIRFPGDVPGTVTS